MIQQKVFSVYLEDCKFFLNFRLRTGLLYPKKPWILQGKRSTLFILRYLVVNDSKSIDIIYVHISPTLVLTEQIWFEFSLTFCWVNRIRFQMEEMKKSFKIELILFHFFSVSWLILLVLVLYPFNRTILSLKHLHKNMTMSLEIRPLAVLYRRHEHTTPTSLKFLQCIKLDKERM